MDQASTEHWPGDKLGGTAPTNYLCGVGATARPDSLDLPENNCAGDLHILNVKVSLKEAAV